MKMNLSLYRIDPDKDLNSAAFRAYDAKEKIDPTIYYFIGSGLFDGELIDLINSLQIFEPGLNVSDIIVDNETKCAFYVDNFGLAKVEFDESMAERTLIDSTFVTILEDDDLGLSFDEIDNIQEE